MNTHFLSGYAGKSEEEHKNELHTELENFSKNFQANFSKGVAISYDDVNYDYKSFGAGSARGAKDIFQEVEQQVASGLDIDPALLGRTYSTTETYAGVVYSAFLSQLENIRRGIKRFLERGYRMHLTMAGLDPSSLKVSFNDNKGLRPKEDAEAKEIKTRVVLMKVQAGIIDRDTAARELGYEKATGTEKSNDSLMLHGSGYQGEKKNSPPN